MTKHDAMEKMVERFLKEQKGKPYCGRCIAAALNQKPRDVDKAVVALSKRRGFTYFAGSAPCAGDCGRVTGTLRLD